jgi:hypothetical protein
MQVPEEAAPVLELVLAVVLELVPAVRLVALLLVLPCQRQAYLELHVQWGEWLVAPVELLLLLVALVLVPV